jgi:hypothetical protein
VPTGIATDYTYREFFADVVERGQLVSLFDFENRRGIFAGVHRSYKFSLLTLRGATTTDEDPAAFAFFLQDTDELHDPERRFRLDADDLARINPNTHTAPVFSTRRDAELTRKLYRAAPVLVNEETGENPWGVSFSTMFHMANDSDLFRTREELAAQGFALRGNRYVRGETAYLPLYEAKLMHQFDHRFATYVSTEETRDMTPDEHARPDALPLPRYWVARAEVEEQAPDARWFLGFRDIARSTDERTGIFAVLPRSAIGHKAPTIKTNAGTVSCSAFVANLNALCFDFVIRQKVGGINMAFFIVEQLPALPPDAYSPRQLEKIVPRVLELTYTAWDIKAFADDLWRQTEARREAGVGAQRAAPLRAALAAQWEANVAATGGHVGEEAPIAPRPLGEGLGRGDDGGFPYPPFKWDGERRAALRAELDGLYGHLYGLSREELAYILDTFPIVRRKDEARYGEYRTKRLVLAAYERWADDT